MESGSPRVINSQNAAKLLRLSAASLSVLFVLDFLLSAFNRLTYTFDLEWVEEVNLQEVDRVLHHLPLYVAPSIHYTPNSYAPVFYWVSAFVTRFTGLSFVAMRLVSILSTIGIFVGIFALVFFELPARSILQHKYSIRLLSAVIGVGLFAITYHITQAFFDVGRVDMLSMYISVMALLAGRRRYPVVAGMLWVVAFQTKQGVLPVALLALCSEWQNPRRLFRGMGTFLALATGSVAWFSHQQPGWYIRWLFIIPNGWPLEITPGLIYFEKDLGAALSCAILIIMAGLLFAPPNWRNSAASFYLFTGFGMVLFTAFLRIHLGAALNAVIPAYIWIAIVTAISFGRLCLLWENRITSVTTTTNPQFGSGVLHASPAAIALVLLLVTINLQLAIYLYPPSRYVPTSEEKRGRIEFIHQMQALPGDILVFEHPQYSAFSGHTSYAGGASVEFVLYSSLFRKQRSADAATVQAAYADLIHQRHFTAIALDTAADSFDEALWLPSDFEKYYPVRALAAGGKFQTITRSPQFLYFPCPSAIKSDPTVLFPGILIDLSRCH